MFSSGRVRDFYTYKKTRFILQILYRNASTSLRSNEVVLEKMLKIDNIKRYPEDEDLLEDVIIENKQAIEMANIYSGILSGTMDAFASIISNNQNNVMKFLAAITIVLSIPTMIASFYRMNFINIPGGDTPHGFVLVTVAALLITVLQFLYLERKNFFNRYERQSVV